MHGLDLELQEFQVLRSRLIYLAWRRYRIGNVEAEDIVQASLLTYLEVRDRYGDEENHVGILSGIFRNKCREHIDLSIREKKRLAAPRVRRTADAGSPLIPFDQTAPSALQSLVKREEGRLILEALSQLRPEALEAFHLLLDRDVGRKGLIDRLRMNKNTVDSRLHLYRKELRRLLRARGVSF